MWQQIKVAVLMGVRTRSFMALLVLGTLLLMIAAVLAGLSGRQTVQVGIDLGLSVIRLFVLLGGILWLQEVVGKEIERKTVFFVLAYPVSRARYVLGRYAGVMVLVAGLLLWLAAMLVAVGWYLGRPLEPDLRVSFNEVFLLVLAGVWLDIAVVCGVVMLVTLLATNPVLPLLAGLIFAFAARSIGPVLDFVVHQDGEHSVVQRGFAPVLDVLRYVIPDLNRLDVRDSLLYGVPLPESLAWGIGHGVTFVALSLSLAVWVFNRREFR